MRSFKVACLALLISAGIAGSAWAQQWATNMFIEGRDHDFGTVARGADVVFKFPVKNLYQQDIRLTNVRSSCGCTTPSIEKEVLKTHEVGHVIAKFNTRTFTGVHGATLTVTIKWTDENGVSRTGEAQLRVDGDIRSDVVFQPGSVRFPDIDQGAKAEQRIRVTYAGRNNWEIQDVLSQCDDLEVELIHNERQSGKASYDLLVRLKDSAEAGDLREQLVLVTSDRSNQRIPVMVEGRVVPEISVAPDSVVLGDVQQGAEVSKKFLVRGKKPFKIVNIACDDSCFSFSPPEDSAERHIVEMRFAANCDVGQVDRTIEILTDLGETYRATCRVFATVVPDPSTETAATDAGNQAAVGASGNERMTSGL